MWTSPYPPVEAGGTTVHRMVLDAAGRFGDRPALVDGRSGTVVSYRLLAERILGVAAGLAARGLAPGDTLALWAPNLPQWAGVALGAMAAGGTVTAASPAATERELATQLADAGRLGAGHGPVAGPGGPRRRGRHRGPRTGRARPGRRRRPDPRPAGRRPPQPRARARPGRHGGPAPLLERDHRAAQGVELTHANLVASVRQVGAGLRVGEGDTLLAVPPLSHIMGFLVTLALPLSVGATVVTVPRFDPAQFLELLERHQVTVLVGAPPMLAVLVGHPLAAGTDMGSLELVVAAGRP